MDWVISKTVYKILFNTSSKNLGIINYLGSLLWKGKIFVGHSVLNEL